MTLQFERKYSTQGSGAPCHVSFSFFSGFFGIILPELQMDPQPESTTQPKARGLLHMECDFCNRISISALASRQHGYCSRPSRAALEDTWDYSRRLQDYSNISWSTFQPRDASNILGDFWLVVLRDA
jgi:hypothetical protein